MFDKKDIEKELKRASQGANSIVTGPDGEPIDQRVIDHFFQLNESGASGWRDSALWERHAAKCLRMQCKVCQSTRYKTSSTSVSWQMSSSPPASTDPPKASRSREKSTLSKEDNTPISRWRLISRKRKFKRSKSHDKGKSIATDELMHISGSLSTSQTQLAEHQHEPKRPRANIFIRNSIRHAQNRPVFCTFISKRLDPAQIPVPAVPDLKPADSSALDLTNPYHFTGRPYSPCPLEEGRLPFPLCGGRLPPPTPELKPEQLVESVPEPLQLTGPVRECPDGAVFPMSPLNSLNPSTFTLPSGHRQTIRLVAPSPEKLFTTYRSDELSTREAESPKSPKTPAATAVSTAATPTTTTTTMPAVIPQHNPTPAAAFPPTPPDSRQNSETFPSGFTYTSYGLKIAAPEAKPMPDGPADRDWTTCTLSDTTASSSPDCPVYVDQRAVSTQRRGLGMGVFR
ncbi:hypothetical protein E8E13_004945 [Curvularia kusanoi]|uniref:Uncharacterized protein n=1 Tax=Curvularia kusanoi TaxID=90978 RepID=A0A9P4TDY5_CURKU|nr:hypothetical protein E8E13_004945 [Curvularia kusanoi]